MVSDDDVLQMFYDMVKTRGESVLSVIDLPRKNRPVMTNTSYQVERVHTKAPHAKIMKAFRRMLRQARDQGENVHARIVDDVVYLSTIRIDRSIDRRTHD
jgi:hypothetical protein